MQYLEAAPPYAPRGSVSLESSPPRYQNSRPRPQSIGLPPIPPLNPRSVVTLPSFRIPTWSANNAPAARHYRNVAERRMTDNRYTANDVAKRQSLIEPLIIRDVNMPPLRPLEDPYLVGEVAARQARRERLTRESGDDILVREDRQWDWLLGQRLLLNHMGCGADCLITAHMKETEERPRSGTRPRREPDTGTRKKLLHRLGGRLLF